MHAHSCAVFISIWREKCFSLSFIILTSYFYLISYNRIYHWWNDKNKFKHKLKIQSNLNTKRNPCHVHKLFMENSLSKVCRKCLSRMLTFSHGATFNFDLNATLDASLALNQCTLEWHNNSLGVGTVQHHTQLVLNVMPNQSWQFPCRSPGINTFYVRKSNVINPLAFFLPFNPLFHWLNPMELPFPQEYLQIYKIWAKDSNRKQIHLKNTIICIEHDWQVMWRGYIFTINCIKAPFNISATIWN